MSGEVLHDPKPLPEILNPAAALTRVSGQWAEGNPSVQGGRPLPACLGLRDADSRDPRGASQAWPQAPPSPAPALRPPAALVRLEFWNTFEIFSFLVFLFSSRGGD